MASGPGLPPSDPRDISDVGHLWNIHVAVRLEDPRSLHLRVQDAMARLGSARRQHEHDQEQQQEEEPSVETRAYQLFCLEFFRDVLLDDMSRRLYPLQELGLGYERLLSCCDEARRCGFYRGLYGVLVNCRVLPGWQGLAGPERRLVFYASEDDSGGSGRGEQQEDGGEDGDGESGGEDDDDASGSDESDYSEASLETALAVHLPATRTSGPTQVGTSTDHSSGQPSGGASGQDASPAQTPTSILNSERNIGEHQAAGPQPTSNRPDDDARFHPNPFWARRQHPRLQRPPPILVREGPLRITREDSHSSHPTYHHRHHHHRSYFAEESANVDMQTPGSGAQARRVNSVHPTDARHSTWSPVRPHPPLNY